VPVLQLGHTNYRDKEKGTDMTKKKDSKYGKIPEGSVHHPTMGCDGCVRFDCESELKGQCITCDHARMMPE